MRVSWQIIRNLWRALWLPRATPGWRWIVFEDGRVAFLAPKGYALHREPDDTVAVYPPDKDSGVTLRFSLHTETLQPWLPADVAERFVADHARDHGLEFTRFDGRCVLTETNESDWPDRRVLIHYWQVGFGRVLVVCSATLWGTDRNSAIVLQALACMPQIIQSIRQTEPGH
jgi:hypothetical protein